MLLNWQNRLLESKTGNLKAARTDRLLYVCAVAAVTIGVFQWAEEHYLRALLAAVVFLVVIPWLGKKWINRSDS